MGKNVWKAAAAAIAVCMLVMVAASLFIEGCTKMLETTAGNMVPMKCHWVFIGTAIVGVVGLVGAACSFVCSTKEGRRVSSILVAVCAVAAIVLTTSFGIGICASAEMACHRKALFVWVPAGIALVIALVQVVKADPKAADAPKMKL